MMQKEVFSALVDAATELGQPELQAKCQALEKHYQERTYCIAFIGQFSAGKSCLINNLLGRQILPQGRQETTPLLTFLRGTKGGETENAKLYYKGGECRNVPIEDVQHIIQHEKDADWNLGQAVALEVFLNAPLLQNGLVLLDTPGVNTKIERHELLLAESLKRAANIVYVSNGVPSKVDAEKLLFLQESGFPLSFVCTHCDQIHSFEESAADVVKENRRIVHDLGITVPDSEMFFVSNLAESVWFSRIERIKAFLQEKGRDVKASLEEDTEHRVGAFCRQMIPQLEALKETLLAQEKQDSSALENRRKKLEASLQALQNSATGQQNRLQEEIEQAKHHLDANMKASVDHSVQKFEDALSEAGALLHPRDMQEKMQASWKDALSDLQKKVNLSMDPILAAVNGKFEADASMFSLDDLPAAEHYSDIVKTQDAALDRLQATIDRIRKEKEEVAAAAADPERMANLQAELDEKEEAYREACRAYDAREPYVPKRILVSEGDKAGTNIGKGIGQTMDIVLMLLPTPAGKAGLVKDVGMIGKVAKTGKWGKNTVTAAKELGVLAKKGAAVLGKVKDAAAETGNVGILDYLSLEYWGGKLGSVFDHPPKYGYDKAYEAEKLAEQERLLNEKRRAEEAKFRLMEQRSLFQSEEERRKARMKSLERAEQEAERELQRKGQQIRKKAEQAAQKAWKKECVAYYRKGLEQAVQSIEEKYLAGIPKRMQAYQVQRFQMMNDRMEQRRQELEKLEEASPEELKSRIAKIAQVMETLKTFETQAG